jgi:hypothetical protein
MKGNIGFPTNAIQKEMTNDVLKSTIQILEKVSSHMQSFTKHFSTKLICGLGLSLEKIREEIP